MDFLHLFLGIVGKTRNLNTVNLAFNDVGESGKLSNFTVSLYYVSKSCGLNALSILTKVCKTGKLKSQRFTFGEIEKTCRKYSIGLIVIEI